MPEPRTTYRVVLVDDYDDAVRRSRFLRAVAALGGFGALVGIACLVVVALIVAGALIATAVTP